MANVQTVVLTKDQIKAAIAQAALASAGVDAGTAGLVTAVRLAEEIDVLVGSSCKASVTITVPS